MNRVLVVDDDPGTLETFGFVLRAEGLAVSLATTGRQATEAIATSVPDLVLCDLHLPDTSGLDVFLELRGRGVSVPFVIVTGFASVTTAYEAGSAGVAAYLEKPVNVGQLVQLVRTHLHDSVVHDTGYTARAKYVMDRRYNEPRLGVREVAQSIGLSPQYLCRLFKHECGVTFGDLLRTIRVKEAQRLIRERSHSLKEVSYLVGFRRSSQFARVFRASCGISPSQYRRQIKDASHGVTASGHSDQIHQ